jgi:hypothetical protein
MGLVGNKRTLSGNSENLRAFLLGLPTEWVPYPYIIPRRKMKDIFIGVFPFRKYVNMGGSHGADITYIDQEPPII